MTPFAERQDIAGNETESRAGAHESLVFGEHNFLRVSYPHLNVVSQIRGKANPEASRLKESIERQGLINNIDVARLAPDAFEAYLKAVQHIYRKDSTAHLVPPVMAPDGFYYLVIAGHTRHAAVGGIIEDKVKATADSDAPLRSGQFDIVCKIYEDLDTEDIFALQMAENFHSTPPPERSAMAIVEYYIYGLDNGLWSNKAEFTRATENKISDDVLTAAIAFADLPTDIREFVFAGTFAYGSAVALGGLVPLREAYLSQRFFDKDIDALDDDETDEVNAILQEWLAVEVLHIQNRKLSVEKTKKYVKSLKSEMERELGEDQPDLTLDFLVDPTEALAEERRSTHRRYKALLDERMSRKAELADRALSMHLALFGDPEAAARMSEQLDMYIESLKRPVGRIAARQALRAA